MGLLSSGEPEEVKALGSGADAGSDAAAGSGAGSDAGSSAGSDAAGAGDAAATADVEEIPEAELLELLGESGETERAESE